MPLSPGARLGPYTIISQLGKGGMGEVYRARDSRLDRDVAIKILSPDSTADENAFIRFEREAKALAALSHTNILAIYDFHRAEDQSYVVMELLEGETLRTQLTRSALPWRQAVEIGIALSDGLHAAHSKGILHRDIKPENIFITHDGQLKILDFGLARLQKIGPLESQSIASTLSQTQPGILLGTVPYMSPEQLRGFPADTRSDLFSLGIVLFEMVTGKSPFKGNTPAETISAIMNEGPPDFPADSNLPDSLRYTILRCLHKDPDQRIQTARELATDLRSIQHGAHITIPSTRPSIRVTRARLFLVLAMLLVLLPAGYFAFYRHGSSNIRSLAILPFANVSGDPDTDYLSDGITESLINSMSRLPQLSVIARTSAFRFKGTTVDPLEIGRQLNVDAVLTGKILQRSGQLIIQADLMKVSTESQLWGDQYSRGLADLLSVQEEIVTEIATNLVPKLSGAQKQSVAKTYTENSEAHLLYLRGMHHWWKGTEEDYEKARDYFQQSIEKDPSYAMAYVGLGDYYLAVAAEGFAPPRDAWPKAATAYKKALEIDKHIALAHRGLGRFESDYHWNWAAAEKELQLALQLEPRNARIHFTYSWYLIGRNKIDSALEELKQAQDLDPLNRSYSLQLGQLLTFTGRYDEGIAQLNRTIELDSKYDAAYFSLADAYERKGMYDEAIAESRKAALLIGDEYAADLYAKAQGAAGYSAAKKTIAIDRLETLKELSTEEYVSPLIFAQLYVQLGNKDQAFYWLNRAAEERATLFPLKIHPDWEPIRSDPRFAKLVERIGLQ